ncbi:hypothetical protein D3C86_1965540 [compost metagenome]
MPEAGQLDNVDLYARSLEADAKEGRVDQIIAKALRDGRICEKEIQLILAAHREHFAAREAEVRAVIILHQELKA